MANYFTLASLNLWPNPQRALCASPSTITLTGANCGALRMPGDVLLLTSLPGKRYVKRKMRDNQNAKTGFVAALLKAQSTQKPIPTGCLQSLIHERMARTSESVIIRVIGFRGLGSKPSAT
jgi:hypothetical protein